MIISLSYDLNSDVLNYMLYPMHTETSNIIPMDAGL